MSKQGENVLRTLLVACSLSVAASSIAHAQTPAAPAPAAKTASAPSAPQALPPIPGDCTGGTDAAKAVVACSTYIKDIGKAGHKDNERMGTVLAARAAAYKSQGLLKPALVDITRALYHAPKNASLWSQRGQIRLGLGQHIRCAADFSIAIKYDPKMVPAYVGRSDCYRRLGALPKAIADASEALKVDPKSAAALAARGYAQLRLGKNDLALADAEAALKSDANNARAYLTRGLAQEKTDKAKADADVKKAVSLDAGLKTEPGMAEILKRFGL